MIDCLGGQFDDACSQLAALVQRRFEADLWVGIETGGAFMLRRMTAIGVLGAATCFVTASRGGTQKKRSAGLAVPLSALPRPVANVCRAVEHLVRQSRFERGRKVVPRHVEIPSEARSRIRGARAIVVVDDAIDSGSSLVQIMEAIKRINPAVELRVAVIVETFDRPLQHADFALHRHVLVRFPWSADAR